MNSSTSPERRLPPDQIERLVGLFGRRAKCGGTIHNGGDYLRQMLESPHFLPFMDLCASIPGSEEEDILWIFREVFPDLFGKVLEWLVAQPLGGDPQ